jgi:NADPH oxidase
MDQLYNLAINDSATTGGGYDPLTKLRSRTFYGRPDFKSIYTRLRGAIEHGAFLEVGETRARTNIGTFFCGVRNHDRFSSFYKGPIQLMAFGPD